LRAILHFYGIQGTATICITAYLTNTQQSVNIKLASTTQNFVQTGDQLKVGCLKG
jgi:hypothetical protein